MKRFITPKLLRLLALIAAMLAASQAWAITPADLAASLARNERLLVIDVRSGTAYQEAHIPGAINVPLALLAHKRLPTKDRVIVYGDGLGVVDDTEALSLVRAKPGIVADVLEGGFAGWLAETRLSTGATGVSREKLPGITYQQLVAANKSDVVLVDLRAPASRQAAADKVDPESGRIMAAAVAPDLLEDFAGELGVPVMRPVRTARMTASAEEFARDAGAGAASIAAQVGADGGTRKLLVLVADNETAANEAARRLRASGYYRFTILIGGIDIVRHEGRVGLSRMDGDAPPVTVEK